MKQTPDNYSQSARDEEPHLPGLRTWCAVYWFVIGCFVLFVALLAILSRAFA